MNNSKYMFYFIVSILFKDYLRFWTALLHLDVTTSKDIDFKLN